MSELDDITTCLVCFEDFDEADHIPRLLPCSHTVCGQCVTQILGNKKQLVCPECRKKHKVKNPSIAFPQNKYILKAIGEELKKSEDKSPDNPTCTTHKREIIFYCKESGCEKAICSLCLIESHNGHRLVDILEEEKTKVYSQIDIQTHWITNIKDRLLMAKVQFLEKNEAAISSLEERKRQLNDILDEMIKKVRTRLNAGEAVLGRKVQGLTNCISMLGRMRKSTETEKIIGKVLKIQEFTEGDQEDIPISFDYFKHDSIEFDEEMVCGKLEESTFTQATATASAAPTSPKPTQMSGKRSVSDVDLQADEKVEIPKANPLDDTSIYNPVPHLVRIAEQGAASTSTPAVCVQSLGQENGP